MRLGSRLQLFSLAIVVMVLVVLVVTPGVGESVAPRSLFIPGAVAAAIAIVLATILSRDISRHIRHLSEVTRSLSRGDMTARPPLTAPGEIGELATAVHRLAEHLGSRITALRAEDALLGALIESLDQGVIAINARREVVRINTAAREILGLTRALPFASDALPRVPQLQAAFDAALSGEVSEPSEAVIRERTVSLTARPLALGGVVIALFDLTRLRRLEAVRRDFVANVSHELRTPLTVISGYSETLAEDELTPEIRKQFAHTIHAHTERMQRIVDDLLDLSRLESGRWEPSYSDLDLSAIAEEIASTFRDAAAAKGLALQLRLDPAQSRIRADRTAVRQILSNLADNAVRHTEHGVVTIFSEGDTSGTWIGVSDTGPGISRDHLPRIFERFYRIDASRGRDTGGTGLGLAIVKHLVDAHGGRVRAESEPGKGTSIAALFPGQPRAT